MSSDRPRGLRDLNPELLFGRQRRAPRLAAPPTLLRFLGALVRRQGQDWKKTCDLLKDELKEAKRAIGIQTARAQAAEKERDEAVRLLASEREAWREERAGLVKERHGLGNDAQTLSLKLQKAQRERAVFVEAIRKVKEIVRAACSPGAARPSVWNERRMRGEPIAMVYDIGLATDRADALIEKAADPDPRQGTPGGTDIIVPDMRGPRGREVPGAEVAQVFFGHSGDMVALDEDEEPAEHVCSRCGRDLDGAFIRDPELGGDLHFDCAREVRKQKEQAS